MRVVFIDPHLVLSKAPHFWMGNQATMKINEETRPKDMSCTEYAQYVEVCKICKICNMGNISLKMQNIQNMQTIVPENMQKRM